MDAITEILGNLDVYVQSFLSNLGIWGALISCFLITFESILPILPLFVFVTLVFYAFGDVAGFFISWSFSLLGCFLSFMLCRTKLKGWFERKFVKGKNKKKIESLMKKIDDMSVGSLASLIAIPFAPAFLFNICGGLSNISKKKFMIATAIGKVFMIYFWGKLGTTFIECLTHPIYLVKIIAMLIIAYVAGRIVNKIFKVD